MTRSQGRAPIHVRAWGATLLLGLLVGAASLLGDSAGIRLLNGLANAAAPWLLVAFVCGALHRGPVAGAIAGATALLIGVLVYYLGVPFVFGADHAYAGPLIAMWLAGSVVGGGVAGGAGPTWSGAESPRRAIAGALPAAALFGEAAHRFVQVEPWEGIYLLSTYAQVMLAEAIAGVVVLWFVSRGRERRTGYLAVAGLSVAGLAALVAVERLARTLAFQ